jgi:hypothetical protein
LLKRVAILAGAYWPLVIFLLFIDLLGDCAADGDPATSCRDKATHVFTMLWIGLGLFVLGTCMLAYERHKRLTSFNPALLGLALSLYFISTFYAAAWFIETSR